MMCRAWPRRSLALGTALVVAVFAVVLADELAVLGTSGWVMMRAISLPLSTPYTATGSVLGSAGCAAGVWLLIRVTRGPRRTSKLPARRVSTSVSGASLHGQVAGPRGLIGGGSATAVTQIVPVSPDGIGYGTGHAYPQAGRSADTTLLPKRAGQSTPQDWANRPAQMLPAVRNLGCADRRHVGASQNGEAPTLSPAWTPTRGGSSMRVPVAASVTRGAEAATTIKLPPVRDTAHLRAVAVPVGATSVGSRSGAATTVLYPVPCVRVDGPAAHDRPLGARAGSPCLGVGAASTTWAAGSDATAAGLDENTYH